MNDLTLTSNRIMLTATGSGAGKTTITCGLLKALINRHKSVVSFKCGPDYIDPMFHSKIIGTKSRNLDIFMCGEDNVKYLLAKNSVGCDISVIEGVMGMYDGLLFQSDYASSNHLSKLTDTPQILIVNVKGMSLSVVALIKGFLCYKENNIKGVILNNCTQGMYSIYKKMIEDELSVHVYGYFPNVKEASIESRHLGLVTANEISDINKKLDLLAKTAEECLDIDAILSLASSAKALQYKAIEPSMTKKLNVKIAVARDNAFCFTYEDNIDLLKKLGAEIEYFSPLNDTTLPNNMDGLILCGGYPEEYAQELSKNKAMLQCIKNAIENKMPTIAECGGFMYLMDSITDKNNISYPMVSAIKGNSYMTSKLSRFGYINLTAKVDNLLCKKGESINAHEFHYSNSDNNGDDFQASKRSKEWDCIHATDTLFAGYPHIHFWGNTNFAVNFIQKCDAYKQSKESL
ncbi:cobyrinate a,c-diamide synthase [Paludicola sp. MB14-C6]|uniref:cobyrinate a,c-diamide synthase n=1 Tax=Paludihabitans sp. MB14-C6 TaxID=3070656 RepID=UPI0027DD7EE9|nr:cobyrinate a,c-diamide synthase [Paludicola sp. MB14-C6]WMJ22043.1 cobyrinate a,c-diamide synthase [Paludicola sp. MB14-C6]